MTDFTNRFPTWGDTGESPSSGYQYAGGDNINQKHQDYLWNSIEKQIDDIIAEFDSPIGDPNTETITETSSPTSFTFNASNLRDYLYESVVTLSNGSSSSVTEDVTVDFYEGSDTTAPLYESVTKSTTVAAGSTNTQNFFSAIDIELETGDYHIEVTTSGTTLSVDQTDVTVWGSEWRFGEQSDGRLTLTDLRDRERLVFTNSKYVGGVYRPTGGPPNFFFQTMEYNSDDYEFIEEVQDKDGTTMLGGKIKGERWGNPPFKIVGTKRAGSHGSLSATSDGDSLFNFMARGSDTNGDPRLAGEILFAQDGAAGSSGVPGRIEFVTWDEAGFSNPALIAHSDRSVSVPNSPLTAAKGTINQQRGDPSTTELGSGENMTYNSDGTGTGAAGDLVYAVNDAGTIKTTILAAKANAT